MEYDFFREKPTFAMVGHNCFVLFICKIVFHGTSGLSTAILNLNRK